MTDQPKKCTVCGGRGYTYCDCWPGDCICGFGDETCEYCEGTGDLYPNEFEEDRDDQ